MRNAKNVEFLRKTIVGKTKNYLYQFDFNLDSILEKSFLLSSNNILNNKVKVWINDNGLPEKIEYQGKTRGKADEEVNSKRIEKFRFDKEIKIKTPEL